MSFYSSLCMKFIWFQIENWHLEETECILEELEKASYSQIHCLHRLTAPLKSEFSPYAVCFRNLAKWFSQKIIKGSMCKTIISSVPVVWSSFGSSTDQNARASDKRFGKPQNYFLLLCTADNACYFQPEFTYFHFMLHYYSQTTCH